MPEDVPIGDAFRRTGNLRHPVTPCIGREHDLSVIASLLAQHRMVTLTGPGGVGKTRLAQELSVGMQDRVADGVWWVDLANAASESDAIGALQRSLRMESGGADARSSLAALTAVLANRDALLVLDNCEHLLDAIAPMVDELLERCGGVRILATSREGFGIPAEAMYRVGPLSTSAAVALFEARLTGAVEDSASSADAIEQICERLDWLPLALELAAARTRHLPLTEILERLSNRFELLRDGSRTAPVHQRNLRAVAGWSYELLDAARTGRVRTAFRVRRRCNPCGSAASFAWRTMLLPPI